MSILGSSIYRANLWGLIAFSTLIACTISLGCTTHSKRISKFRQAFHQGDFEAANAESERLLKKNKKDTTLIKLDQSLVRLAEGKPSEAEDLLREVRNGFDSDENLAAVTNVTSLLLDDQTRLFQPDDYEKLFVLAYLSLTNLVQNGDDAYAYANQLMTLQTEIENRIRDAQPVENPSNENVEAGDHAKKNQTVSHQVDAKKDKLHKRIALAPFIAAILHEQTHRDYDAAERYYRRTLEYLPNFRGAAEGLRRVTEGHHSQKGNGVLYVFTAIGKGPIKVEQAEIPTSQAMLIADRILSAMGDHTLPPTLAPIKTARVIVPRNAIQTVEVSVDSTKVGTTETISDLGQIALEQDKAMQHVEMARAIVRRIAKKSTVYMGKDALKTVNHSGVDMLVNLGGVLWEAAETADTRSWGLLPEKIQVLRIELPVGTHQVDLMPVGVHAANVNSANIEIHDGFNTYLFATFPNERLAGKILVSGK